VSGAGKPALRRDWWAKSTAGALGGLGLGIALAGLLVWLTPGGPGALNKYQFAMWLVSPLWLGVLSLCFLFPSGRAAWAWLGGANALAFSALAACRHFLG
jgi:hypothetical protein